MGEEEEEKVEAEEGEAEGDEAAVKGDEEEEEPLKKGAKKLTNQFNFCERAALTYNLPTRVSPLHCYSSV